MVSDAIKDDAAKTDNTSPLNALLKAVQDVMSGNFSNLTADYGTLKDDSGFFTQNALYIALALGAVAIGAFFFGWSLTTSAAVGAVASLITIIGSYFLTGSGDTAKAGATPTVAALSDATDSSGQVGSLTARAGHPVLGLPYAPTTPSISVQAGAPSDFPGL